MNIINPLTGQCYISNIRLSPDIDYTTATRLGDIMKLNNNILLNSANYTQLIMIYLFTGINGCDAYRIEPREESNKFMSRCRELMATNMECAKIWRDFATSFIYCN